MDRELLKRYKIEEAVKRFQQINEYTFITAPLISEEGEDDAQPQDMNGGQQQPNDTTQAPQQNDGGMEQGQPMDANMQNNMDMSQQQPMQQDMQGGQQQPQVDLNVGGDVNDNSGEEVEDIDIETDDMQDGDEVIDVDELTQSQEETEYKVDGVNQKLSKLLNVVNKFTSALEANDQKIEDLKAEFEKRNPTPEEKLNLRSQSSYPYSETPKGYWDKKMQDNPHYNVMYNNNVSPDDEQKEFEIKRSDIGGNVNTKEISDSFSDALKLDDFLSFD